MNGYLTIGGSARATHLSVKALRYHHSVGVLTPAAVDSTTGYRRYRTDQIAVAQIIRRFRNFDMPIEDIQAVLAAPDVAIRSKVIATHLSRIETLLERTHRAAASLRDLLQAQAAPRWRPRPCQRPGGRGNHRNHLRPGRRGVVSRRPR